MISFLLNANSPGPLPAPEDADSPARVSTSRSMILHRETSSGHFSHQPFLPPTVSAASRWASDPDRGSVPNTTDFHTQKEDNLRTGCGDCSEDNARSSSSSANGTRTGPRTPCFLRFWLFQVTENLFLFCLTSVCDGSHFGEVASH